MADGLPRHTCYCQDRTCGRLAEDGSWSTEWAIKRWLMIDYSSLVSQGDPLKLVDKAINLLTKRPANPQWASKQGQTKAPVGNWWASDELGKQPQMSKSLDKKNGEQFERCLSSESSATSGSFGSEHRSEAPKFGSRVDLHTARCGRTNAPAESGRSGPYEKYEK